MWSLYGKREGTPAGEDKAVCQDDFSHARKLPPLLFFSIIFTIHSQIYIHTHTHASWQVEQGKITFFFLTEVKPEGNFAPWWFTYFWSNKPNCLILRKSSYWSRYKNRFFWPFTEPKKKVFLLDQLTDVSLLISSFGEAKTFVRSGTTVAWFSSGCLTYVCATTYRQLFVYWKSVAIIQETACGAVLKGEKLKKAVFLKEIHIETASYSLSLKVSCLECTNHRGSLSQPCFWSAEVIFPQLFPKRKTITAVSYL